LEQLDRLLGRGVVSAEQDGSLRLNDAVLRAQLHRRSLPKGERCWCSACKAERERKPEPAAAPVRQPWEPRAEIRPTPT